MSLRTRRSCLRKNTQVETSSKNVADSKNFLNCDQVDLGHRTAMLAWKVQVDLVGQMNQVDQVDLVNLIDIVNLVDLVDMEDWVDFGTKI